MPQILQTNANNISIGRRLLASGQKVIVSQREAARLAASSIGDELLDLGPGILFTSEITLSGISENGKVVASITPGFAGRVVAAFALVSEPVTTASRAATLSLAIDQEPGTDEVQTLTITGSPTGGTFTLTFDGQTTAAIAYNAAAAAVQSALEALSNVAAGDVVCAGGALPGTPVTITFGGSYAGRDVALITATPSLTGGTAPTATVALTTSGAPGADALAAAAVQGGAVALTSANATPSGKVVSGSKVIDATFRGSAANGSNHFDSNSIIRIVSSGVTAFAEGKVLVGILCAPAYKEGAAVV